MVGKNNMYKNCMIIFIQFKEDKMSINENIKDNFNKGYFDRAMRIEGLPEEYPAWTIKQNRWVGVGVPLEQDMLFTEKFSNVRIWVANGTIIDNKEYNLLMLTCKDMLLRDEFAAICAQFVEPGVDGEKRRRLIVDPEGWWNNWKLLLGNITSTKEAYPELAELMVVEELLLDDMNPQWGGAKGTSHDIEANVCAYEVKSTINRYGYEIQVNSIYQLKHGTEDLKLVFYRFERSRFGRSVDDLVKSLTLNGYSKDALEEVLSKRGFEKGCTARAVKYKVLERKVYLVNKDFPAVTEDSFVDKKLPKNVTKFIYTIDLAGIPSENGL